jgi:hypothetical protein
LQQLDSQALEESFQCKLGGCIDVVEHDSWEGWRRRGLWWGGV